MNVQKTTMLHIGPLREESQRLLQQQALPALAISPPGSSLPGNLAAHINTVKAWVTTDGRDQQCYRFSLPDFNSLSEASGLCRLYPGITLLETYPVETQLLDNVLAEQGVGKYQIKALIIEQADQAQALMIQLNEQGALASLDQLWIRTGPIALYECMPEQNKLLEWCAEHGFDPIQEVAEDPEFHLQAFKRNRLHGPLHEAQQQNSDLRNQLEVLTTERKALNSKWEVAQAEAQQAKEQYEALLHQHEELKERHQQFKIELERAEAQLELIKELLLKDKLIDSQSDN